MGGMSERDKFESWRAGCGYNTESIAGVLWMCWQDARQAALEDAAVCAEMALCECCYSESERENGDEIAFQIRNRLKAKEQA